MKTNTHPRSTTSPLLRWTLRSIAFVQFFFGALFLAAPENTARLFGFEEAPGWTHWLLGMMSARFIGYGIGMLAAARDPRGNRLWIQTMIGVQATDWVLSLIALSRGSLHFNQAPTAFLFPVVWIALLLALRKHWSRAEAA